MPTTGDGVADISGLDLGSDPTDGETAFIAHFLKKDPDAFKKPSEDKGEPKDQQQTDDNEDEHEASEQDDAPDAEGEDKESDGKDETTEKARKYVDIDDSTFIKVKVGDAEEEYSLKSLQRLAGQEAALTRKSQETAEVRKTADAETAKAVATLNAMLQRAQEKSKPFKELDFLTLSRRDDISNEELAGLRQAAQAAFEEEQFLGTELNTFMQAIQKTQAEQRVEAAKSCIKALSTAPTEAAPNPHYIEGWGDKLYDEVRAFAVSQGMDQSIVNSVTDAPAIKLMHMAMLYQRGNKGVVTKTVNKTPKKIVKSNKSPEGGSSSSSDAKNKALAKLRSSGSTDDAAEAFLAGFKHRD